MRACVCEQGMELTFVFHFHYFILFYFILLLFYILYILFYILYCILFILILCYLIFAFMFPCKPGHMCHTQCNPHDTQPQGKAHYGSLCPGLWAQSWGWTIAALCLSTGHIHQPMVAASAVLPSGT